MVFSRYNADQVTDKDLLMLLEDAIQKYEQNDPMYQI